MFEVAVSEFVDSVEADSNGEMNEANHDAEDEKKPGWTRDGSGQVFGHFECAEPDGCGVTMGEVVSPGVIGAPGVDEPIDPTIKVEEPEESNEDVSHENSKGGIFEILIGIDSLSSDVVVEAADIDAKKFAV